jgi:hypothetical protein
VIFCQKRIGLERVDRAQIYFFMSNIGVVADVGVVDGGSASA